MTIIFWLGDKLLSNREFDRRLRAYHVGCGFRLFGRNWGIPTFTEEN